MFISNNSQVGLDINDLIQFCEIIINHITVIKGFTQLRIKEEHSNEIL